MTHAAPCWRLEATEFRQHALLWGVSVHARAHTSAESQSWNNIADLGMSLNQDRLLPCFFFSHYIFLVWTQFEIKAAALFISGCLQVGSSQLGLGLHGSDEWTWSHLGPDQVPASWASCPQWRPEARTKTSHVALDPSEPFEEELDPHDDVAKKKNTLKPCEQVFSLINQANKTPWLLPQPWSSSSAPDTRIQHFYSLHGFLNVDS